MRIHVGPESDELNSRIQARAFTTGRDIFVRRQDYSPSTEPGQALLAHELAHTLQQGGQRPASGVARLIQRYTDVPTRAQWKADTAVARTQRSDLLKSIDTQLAAMTRFATALTSARGAPASAISSAR